MDLTAEELLRLELAEILHLSTCPEEPPGNFLRRHWYIRGFMNGSKVWFCSYCSYQPPAGIPIRVIDIDGERMVIVE